MTNAKYKDFFFSNNKRVRSITNGNGGGGNREKANRGMLNYKYRHYRNTFVINQQFINKLYLMCHMLCLKFIRMDKNNVCVHVYIQYNYIPVL